MVVLSRARNRGEDSRRARTRQPDRPGIAARRWTEDNGAMSTLPSADRRAMSESSERNRVDAMAVEVQAARPDAPRRWLRIGVDTGGTFTDVVAVDETTGAILTTKTPSTPH